MHKKFTQMCKTIVDEKNKCSWFRAENIDQRCTSYTNFEKKTVRKISHEEGYIYIYIVNLKKQKKSICHWLLFIPYSIWVHVESPKYIMICLKSPKSSEFDIVLANSGQISLTMFISSCFNNCSIGF